MPEQNLTERQAKWFATIRAGLERDTGRSLAEWAAIATSCPAHTHRERLRWFKQTHGIPQNRAAQILAVAFPQETNRSQPAALIDQLWSDPASRAILDAVDAAAMDLEGAVRTARKGYTAWSRRVQFAALRPLKGGAARLGLAVSSHLMPGLEQARSESWSERLTARLDLACAAEVDDTVRQALQAAWQDA